VSAVNVIPLVSVEISVPLTHNAKSLTLYLKATFTKSVLPEGL
jgi:hypothetical protein